MTIRFDRGTEQWEALVAKTAIQLLGSEGAGERSTWLQLSLDRLERDATGDFVVDLCAELLKFTDGLIASSPFAERLRGELAITADLVTLQGTDAGADK